MCWADNAFEAQPQDSASSFPHERDKTLGSHGCDSSSVPTQDGTGEHLRLRLSAHGDWIRGGNRPK